MMRKRIWIPGWLDKELTTLSNHKNVGKDDLLLAAAILGYPKLTDMTAEQIIAVLEKETLR